MTQLEHLVGTFAEHETGECHVCITYPIDGNARGLRLAMVQALLDDGRGLSARKLDALTCGKRADFGELLELARELGVIVLPGARTVTDAGRENR